MATRLGLLVALAFLIMGTAGQGSMKPKECSADEDCKDVPNTKCLSDPTDSKMRCLCKNKRPAIDGHCLEGSGKVVNSPCEDEHDCPKNADCNVFTNSTVTEVTNPDKKVCSCKENFREFSDGTLCVALGRLCTNDGDCKQDTNTTCVEDREDQKKRCLCGSGNAPGVLKACNKGALLLPCNSNDECPIHAQCSTATDGKKNVCNCVKGFKTQDNIKCEVSSATRVAMMSVVVIFLYVSITTVL